GEGAGRGERGRGRRGATRETTAADAQGRVAGAGSERGDSERLHGEGVAGQGAGRACDADDNRVEPHQWGGEPGAARLTDGPLAVRAPGLRGQQRDVLPHAGEGSGGRREGG